MSRAASLVLLAMASSFLALGCASASSSGGASLTVACSAPNAKALAARTVAASASELLGTISTLDITVFDSSGAEVQADHAVAYAAGATTRTFSYLAAGSYTISVVAYDSSRSPIASGSSGSVSVAADATSSVTVALSFLQSSTGGFSLALRWPSSTGLAYVSASLDDLALPAPAVTESSGLYSTTIAKSGVASGSHALSISFKPSSASPTVEEQHFYETVNVWNGVTSDMWIDGSGNCVAVRVFSASDFFSTNCSLGGIEIRDGSSSGSVLSTGFSSASTSYEYSLSELPSTRSIVITPTASVDGQYICYSWNGGAATALASGSNSTTLAFVTSVYDNTLSISVRAPDRYTSRTYTLVWHSGASMVGVTTSVSYAALGFPASAYSIARGSSISVAPSDSALAAVSSGWTWYIDGVAQSGMTGPSFSLSPATSPSTSSMIGVYQVAAKLTRGGIVYSGGFTLTVTW